MTTYMIAAWIYTGCAVTGRWCDGIKTLAPHHHTLPPHPPHTVTGYMTVWLLLRSHLYHIRTRDRIGRCLTRKLSCLINKLSKCAGSWYFTFTKNEYVSPPGHLSCSCHQALTLQNFSRVVILQSYHDDDYFQRSKMHHKVRNILNQSFTVVDGT